MPQGATASQRRDFRRKTAWCWQVAPQIESTGEVYAEIQLDGTYLNDGWCLLTAITGSGMVLGWQWCDQEKTAAWKALLERIPAPQIVVIDGGRGLASALRECWPDTRIQRCLVHVQRNVRTYLTTNPRTEAAKTLRALSLKLTRITTVEQARAWEVALHDWHQIYAALLEQKTFAGENVIRPSWAKAAARWWYTHDRLRRAYNIMAHIVRTEVAFTYLDNQFDGLAISSTTNRIEGGVNRQVKELLSRHRGMNSEHQRRACEWWLYLHSANPEPATALIKPEHWQPLIEPEPVIESDGPSEDDRGVATAEEGLWIRKGWAGRNH